MSLLDDLRAIGEKIPPSHLPTAQELLKLAGATLLYLEHGQQFVDDLKKDDATLADALNTDQVSGGAPATAPAVDDPTPASAAPAPVHAAPADVPAETPESVDDQLAMLHKQQEQIATAIAALQRGQVATGVQGEAAS